MASRGVHFAIKQEEYEKLIIINSDEELINFIQENFEEKWEKEWLHETDKAWDAIHRSLTDGKLEWDNGKFPLKEAIIGGQNLYKGDYYIVSVVTPAKVPMVAEALKVIDKNTFKQGYYKIDKDTYNGEIGEEDFEYTWECFEGLRQLFNKALLEDRAVIFTVDL